MLRRRIASVWLAGLLAFGMTFAAARPAAALEVDSLPITAINTLSAARMLQLGVTAANPGLVGVVAVGAVAAWCMANDCGGTVLHWVTDMGGTATQGRVDTYADQGTCGYWSKLPTAPDPVNVIAGQIPFEMSNGCGEIAASWDLVGKCSNPDGTYSTVSVGYGFIMQGGAAATPPIGNWCQGTGQLLVALYSGGSAKLAWEAIGYAPVNRSITQDMTCRNAAGTEVVVSSTTNYQGSSVDAAVPSCPSGYVPKKVDLYQGTTNAGKGAKVGTTGLTDSAFTAYPRCVTGDLRGTCTVGVWILDGTQLCTTNLGGCANVGLPEGPAWRCQWGPYLVHESNCTKVLRQLTPTAVPSPSPSPSASSSGSPWLQPPPAVDPNLGPSENPTGWGDCAPTGWGWLDPTTWVQTLGPSAICIVKLLIVPQGGMLELAQSAGAVVTSTTIGQWAGAALDVPRRLYDAMGTSGSTGGWPSGAGTNADGSDAPDCKGPVFHVALPGVEPVSVAPLDACSQPMATVAHTVKVVLGGVVGVSVALWIANVGLGLFNGGRLPFGKDDL